MKITSPLRYPGGKTRACAVLDNILSNHVNMENINKIVSPFFGGGSFEFYLQSKYGVIIEANDLFTPLYNFWNVAKDEQLNVILCKMLEDSCDVTCEIFKKLRDEIMNIDDPLQQALYYFIINRCSFSGATLSGGFSKEASTKRFTQSSINRVKMLPLAKFTITNIDFEKFLTEIDVTPNTLIFLDPPYYLEKKSKLYGNNGDLHINFDHERLRDVLNMYHGWIMTYNNCDYIKKLYDGYKIMEVGWSYGMSTDKKSSEIVILG
jgi:DNA adenine methylase